jgi:mannose-6-phosphate isomerase-like protein (cupin superfamily)
MSETLKLTPHESLVVRRAEQDVLEVEVTYGPGGNPPPRHLHPAQDEHFEVLEGTLGVKVGGRELRLGPGETLDVPRGTAHQMWNAGEGDTRAIWRTMPAGRTLEWFRALHAAADGGRASALAVAPLLREYDDVFRLAAPKAVMAPVLAGASALGRLTRKG